MQPSMGVPALLALSQYCGKGAENCVLRNKLGRVHGWITCSVGTKIPMKDYSFLKQTVLGTPPEHSPLHRVMTRKPPSTQPESLQPHNPTPGLLVFPPSSPCLWLAWSTWQAPLDKDCLLLCIISLSSAIRFSLDLGCRWALGCYW